MLNAETLLRLRQMHTNYKDNLQQCHAERILKRAWVSALLNSMSSGWHV